MEKINIALKSDDFSLSLITTKDFEDYYQAGFTNIDDEVTYLTGSVGNYSKETILSYINKIVLDNTRYDFLIRDKTNKIIGEVVINEIDYEAKSANYRIAIFKSSDFNKGYGSKSSNLVINFCFDILKLHRLELDVYSFNKRAIKVYQNLGFDIEGIKRDSYFHDGEYHDIILMSIINKKDGRLSKEKHSIKTIGKKDLTSAITFLYFENYENAKNFFENTLELETVSDKNFAKIYRVGESSYIGIVKKASGSIDEKVLISLNTSDVQKAYNKLLKFNLNQTEIKTIKQIPLKSFFFKGPENYDFEIQEFINEEDKIIFEWGNYGSYSIFRCKF